MMSPALYSMCKTLFHVENNILFESDKHVKDIKLKNYKNM